MILGAGVSRALSSSFIEPVEPASVFDSYTLHTLVPCRAFRKDQEVVNALIEDETCIYVHVACRVTATCVIYVSVVSPSLPASLLGIVLVESHCYHNAAMASYLDALAGAVCQCTLECSLWQNSIPYAHRHCGGF